MFAENNLLLDLGDTLVSINESFEIYTKKAISNVLLNFDIVDDNVVGKFIDLRNEVRSEAHKSEKETNIRSFLKQGVVEILHQNINEKQLEEMESVYVQAELDITGIFTDAISFLKSAKNHGKIIYIVTNNFSTLHVEYLVDKFNIRKYFSGIYISGAHGYRKPHRLFLEIFFNIYKIDPLDSIIIGDKYSMDVIAGKNVEIKTCLLNRNKSNIDMSNGPPDYLINTLSEINFS